MNRKYIRSEAGCFVEIAKTGGMEYEYRMLTENRIGNLLPVKVEASEEGTVLRYEVGHKKPFWITSEKMWISYPQLCTIVDGILNMAEQLEHYLLDRDSLVLDLNCLFWDLNCFELYFIYLPGYKKDFISQLAGLIEKLLGKIDHRDKKGIYFAYDLHRILVEEHPDPEWLKGYRNGEYDPEWKKEESILPEKGKTEEKERRFHNSLQKKEEKRRETEREEEQETGERRFHRIRKQEKKEKIHNKKIYVLLVAAGISVLIMSGILFGIYRYGITEWKRNLLLSMLLLLVVLLICLRSVWDKERERKELFDLMEKTEEKYKEIYEEQVSPEVTPCADETTLLSQMEGEGSGWGKSPSEGRKKTEERWEECISLIPDRQYGVSEIHIRNTPFVIGSWHNGVDYCLNRKGISRFHLSVLKKDGEYFIKDLHSTNGTCLNQKRLEPGEEIKIRDGDRIIIADLPCTVQIRKQETDCKL